ncbi:MAG: hypothetical protein NVS9B3_00990 [Gemmatimonadaceae bacterium]
MRAPTAVAAGAALFALVYVTEEARVASARAAHAAAALRASNAEALADSTRRLAGVTGNSAVLWQRRAVQLSIERDRVDRALRVESAARASIAARYSSLQRTVASDAAVLSIRGGARTATFALRDGPFALTARADLPPTGSGTLAVHVAADPIRLDVRVTCGAVDDGIRAASIVIAAPSWLTVTATDVAQSADVCRSPALARSPRRWYDRLGVSAGYGIVSLPDGTLRAGPVLAAGVRLWP